MKAQLVVAGYPLTFFPGDFTSLFSLFFDNLSTLLTLSGAIMSVLSGSPDLARKIVFRRMVPACGVMLFVGNMYYGFQSARLTKEKGRQYTAQPYGLGGAGAFPFIFGIMLPIALGAVCDVDGDRAVVLAYQVGVAANFLTGMVHIALGIVGHYVLWLAPTAAFLTPLAGIGIVWLSINQILPNLSAPFPGLLPVFMCFFAYYSGCLRRANGEARIPEALQIVVPALIMAYCWQGPVFSFDRVEEEVDSFEGRGLYWAFGDIAEGFKHLGNYLGIILPISLLNGMLDLMVLVSARQAGDAYNIRETMIVDGIGTMIGAVLGSPIETVVYIGHPIHKKNGAGNGYSIINGFLYLILTLSGVYPIVASAMPLTATGPIIMVFGLIITQQAFESVKPRHWPAIIVGLFFFVLDFAGAGDMVGDGSQAGELDGYLSGFYGKMAMTQSAPLNSLIWASLITFTIDRRWGRAIFWSCFAAACAGSGVIHQQKAFPNSSEFANGLFVVDESCGGSVPGLSEEAKEGYGPTSPMWFMLGYLSIAATCAAAWGMNKAGFKESFPDPVHEDGVDDIFDNWYADPKPSTELDGDPKPSTKLDDNDPVSDETI